MVILYNISFLHENGYMEGDACRGNTPGMKELMLSIDALIGKDLHKSVGLISDARFSGFNFGAMTL